MNPIMTSTQVAAIFDCEPSTVNEWARTRVLPATKIGGSWVFTSDTLLPYLNRMIESDAQPKAKAVKVKTTRDVVRELSAAHPRG